jgi:hypothetical protein
MRAIVIVMLVIQAAIILVTAYTVMFGRASPRNPRRPVWSSLAISLVVIASTSWRIGEDHPEDPGAEILLYGAPLLLGLGLMAIFMLIRQRRGLDAPSA